MLRLVAILGLLFSCISPGIFIASAKAQSSEASVIISEIQTGAYDELLHEDGRKEFIELHNQTNQIIDVSGWRLQYFSATKEDALTSNGIPSRELLVLEGSVNPYGFLLFSYDAYIAQADGYFGQGSTVTSGLLARSGGHVRLVDSANTVVDVVGWGAAKSPETKALAEIKPAFSAQRIITNGQPVDTNNNFADFSLTDTPSPVGGGLVEVIPIIELEQEPQIIPEDVEPNIPVCSGLVITEILPNPDGDDTGKEFIELYNPTSQRVYLEGCVLKTSGSSGQYRFLINSTIEPGAYLAFYESVTNLNLPNAAGGQVLLIMSDSDYSIEYPPETLADHSWSFIEGNWHDTIQVTPNLPNVLLTSTEQEDSESEEVLEPCPEGKFRNPETNRCKNIQLLATSLLPCAAGQERNLETNRCRIITSIVSGLTPCRPNQERNPETNRCRTITNDAQTDCQDGYERNTETNRCRKKAAVLAASSSVGALHAQSEKKLNYIFLTLMSLLVLGYGVFEYRRDMLNLYHSVKAKRQAKLLLKSD